jgi:hypothetical protein
MADTETIIRQLQQYMEGASKDELDELKQAEINAVIDRLLQQESIQKKQEKMWEQIDSMDLELAQQHKINEHQAEEIKHNKEKNDEQDRELKLQVQKDEEHDRLLEESKKKNEEQDEELDRQAKNDERHDLLFEKQKEINNSFTKELDKLSDGFLSLQNKVNDVESQKASKSMNIISLLIALAAVGLSIVQLFI